MEPITKRYPRLIRGKEIFAQPKPPKEMVWELCPYLLHRNNLENPECAHCPTWEEDPQHGPVQRGCYGLAEEACRLVFAARERFKTEYCAALLKSA